MYRCLRKKPPLPFFSPRAYLELQNGATNAEKHGESESTAPNAPKPLNKSQFEKKSKSEILRKFKLPQIPKF